MSRCCCPDPAAVAPSQPKAHLLALLHAVEAGDEVVITRRRQLTAEQAQTIGSEFESFRQERLTLIEPRGTDFLQARQWLERCLHLPLRSGDALHLALAQRQQLTVVSADRVLARCAESLGLPLPLIG